MSAVLESPSVSPYTPPVAARAHEVRYPVLDGLRCIAVLLVVWDHAGAHGPHSFGRDGVRLFFVLSGFLITGILLRIRDARVPFRSAVRAFYARRFLRLAPPYYLVVALYTTAAVLAGVGLAQVWRDALANVLYLSNWRFIAHEWPANVGHFWTLAVEEQFYLVWPALVLLARPAWLPRVIAAVLIGAVLTRAGLLLGGHVMAARLGTFPNLDALSLGAMLAWHHHTYPVAGATRARWARAALVLGAAGVALTLALGGEDRSAWLETGAGWGESLAAVWVLEWALRGRGSLVHRALAWRPATAVGRVSYGIYLVQSPIWWTLAIAHGSRGMYAGGVAFFLLVATLSIAVAALLWRYVEAPVNAWKRHFPYVPGEHA